MKNSRLAGTAAPLDEEMPSEHNACSMLCDDIPYELLAAGR